MGKFMGKIVLIMGVLQGIGEGIVRIFVCYGVNLILLDIFFEIEKLVDELCGCGYCCMVVVVDVCDLVLVVVVIKCVKEKEGCIDILVNNVGVCCLGSFFDMSDDDCDFYIDINIKGVWNVMKVVLLEMIVCKDGCIVMMFLVIGDMVVDFGEMVYVLMKAVIVGLIKLLVVEYVQFGICVNVICLGYVCILMVESIVCQLNLEDLELVLIEMVKVILMCCFVDLLEVGELVVFFVLDEFSYLIGIQNVIDGGSILLEMVSVGI